MRHNNIEFLFPLAKYCEYRAHTRKQRYCDPFVPVVGSHYGDGALIKFVYSGVAAAWQSLDCEEGEDSEIRERSLGAWSLFFNEGMNGSRFWDLFDNVLNLIDGRSRFSVSERRQHAVWTNLSKTGLPGKTAAGGADSALRQLDAAQFRRELVLLKPDLLLCVSGRFLAATGHEIFDGWPDSDIKPSVAETSIKRMPGGGWLYWTMHPGRQPNTWRDAVLGDISRILERINAPSK